jgi:hypothetical protein
LQHQLFVETLTEEQAVPCPNCGKPILTEKFCSGCGMANPINYIDESVRVSKSRVVRRTQKRHFPVRAIGTGIGIAAILMVAGFFGNNYALENMQFKVKRVSGFDYGSLTSQVELEACNPTAFPAGFDRFDAIVYYRGGEFARIAVKGGSVMPYQSAPYDGNLKLSAQTVSGIVIALADTVGGKDSPYDENEITIKMTMESKVLGLMPYSQTKEFTFAQFQEFMGTKSADKYLCA